MQKSLSGYVWTKPRRSKERSYQSAENMVSSKLLSERGIGTNFPDFGNTIRTNFPDVVVASREYIGETREIELPEGMNPKQYQVLFHTVRYNPPIHDESLDDISEEESNDFNPL